jgi:hypothetical protein
LDGEFVYRYSVKEQEYNRRISAAFLVPRIADQMRERSLAYRKALEECFDQRRVGDNWLLSQYSGSATGQRSTRPETLFGVRIDSGEMSKILPVGNSEDLRKAIEMGASLNFDSAFSGLCQKLRPSRGSAHIFLFRPEAAHAIDSASLTEAAKEALVTVHAICGSPDEEIREVCQSTGGFYAVSENVTRTLSGFYRGLSHRYLATMSPDNKVRQVQVAVRTADSSGESAISEINI